MPLRGFCLGFATELNIVLLSQGIELTSEVLVRVRLLLRIRVNHVDICLVRVKKLEFACILLVGIDHAATNVDLSMGRPILLKY